MKKLLFLVCIILVAYSGIQASAKKNFMPGFPHEKYRDYLLKTQYQCKDCSYNSTTDTLTCSCIVKMPGYGEYSPKYQTVSGSGCKFYKYNMKTKKLECGLPEFPQEKFRGSNPFGDYQVGDYQCKNCSYNPTTDTLTCSCLVKIPKWGEKGEYKTVSGSGCKAYKYNINTQKLECKEQNNRD